MLILTRRLEEELVLVHQGVQIRISPQASKGRQVKIGIDAPEEVRVYREEHIEELEVAGL